MSDTDAALVRLLLAEQHPDLADLPLRRAREGWDNEMWRLGDELAVRLPVKPRAPSLLLKEAAWLPRFAHLLPIPVSVAVRTGVPSEAFPKPWLVTRWVAGEPADHAPISAGIESAATLARFLNALHQPAPRDAPINDTRGVPLAEVRDAVARRLVDLPVPIDWLPVLESVWSDACAAPLWTEPLVWLHNDLHPANVITQHGALAGVVDFGELGAGDPASDLVAAWTLLPSAALTRFFAAYEHNDPATLRRARGRAIGVALALLGVGQAGERGEPGGKVTWGTAGRATLERLVVERRASE